MAPIKPGQYEFRPESIVEIRQRLKLTQAKMASLLGVPANTVSRWETGATTPDAESLAAIYSAAVERELTPNFFQRRRPVSKPSQQRSRLYIMWDFQNLGVAASSAAPINSWIRSELEEKRFRGTSHRLYKAFSHPSQSSATDRLEKLGWRVWEDNVDMDTEIRNQARSDCGQEPKDTILVIVTKDGDFASLAQELKSLGTEVYLIAPESGSNQKLVQAVGGKRWIKLPQNYSFSPARVR